MGDLQIDPTVGGNVRGAVAVIGQVGAELAPGGVRSAFNGESGFKIRTRNNVTSREMLAGPAD
ncbi:MAG TPA: hypothetical protein VFS52_08760 [Steroidobacteraceae bacterium]|nr:hypothetical protein [Steroidobacteraceae bacterium]